MTQRIGTAGLLRRAATGATAVLAATTLLAGCSGGGAEDSSGPSPSSSPSADPKAALLASVPDDKDPAFRFGGTDEEGAAISGLVDPAAKGTELSVTQKNTDPEFTMKLSFRVIEERSWMKVAFVGADELAAQLKLPKKWMELDESKIKDPAGVPGYEGPDPGNAGVIIENASGVTQQPDGSYAGTVDVTADPDMKEALEVDEAALGDKARAIPFTATIGPDGNLATLALKIPAAGKKKAVTYSVKYYDFGTAPKLAAPAGSEAQAAPATAYEMLNG
ncbi:hypothetical protein [Micromonospora endolithica]|uniref:LppX_LprAFG lipoprotein n=1 Tax=Micromonospora endolithica TaxID=230091 RepID=A0A3A9Z7I7_9ACTN|nr:hypothetical protein [Micromonospora endolithica]RKN44263.1 hypothetical protein D7223_18490 [Micromonospora endolithica]TWJ25732.1 hypothetical protein JD76_05905 [Micromonospora endolithica]